MAFQSHTSLNAHKKKHRALKGLCYFLSSFLNVQLKSSPSSVFLFFSKWYDIGLQCLMAGKYAEVGNEFECRVGTCRLRMPSFNMVMKHVIRVHDKGHGE